MTIVTERPSSTVSVTPLTGTLGAEISGVDLSQTLDAHTVAEIRDALVRYRVVFFRNQDISPTDQVRFAATFGELTPAHPLVGGLDDAHPEVLVLDSANYPLGVGDKGNGTSYNNSWHTDVTFSATPPLASVLVARTIPARGGDTLWADLVNAYETLSAPVRELIDGLVAVHHTGNTFSAFRDGAGSDKLAQLEPVRHPVVRVHPETGEKMLFVNPTFTSHIEGVSAAESKAILELLYAHTTVPERVVRWHWSEGDIAVWDNRSTTHYAAADYTGHRVMHRVTVRGDRPYGPQGSID